MLFLLLFSVKYRNIALSVATKRESSVHVVKTWGIVKEFSSVLKHKIQGTVISIGYTIVRQPALKKMSHWHTIVTLVWHQATEESILCDSGKYQNSDIQEEWNIFFFLLRFNLKIKPKAIEQSWGLSFTSDAFLKEKILFLFRIAAYVADMRILIRHQWNLEYFHLSFSLR